MAELPDVGKHCSLENCNRLDFLPMYCIHCGKIYCKDHHSISKHNCDDVPDKQSCVVSTSVCENQKCAVAGCKDRCSAVQHRCPYCDAHICIKHRHETPQHHSCPSASQADSQKLQIVTSQGEHMEKLQEAFSVVEEEINEKLKTALHGRKKVMAHQLRLMRLKSRAIGDQTISVPMSSRAYFAIIPPNSHTSPHSPLPIYISKTWSLGKSIDSIEKILKLNCINNQKLRLLAHSDQSVICNDMSQTVQSLLDNGSLIEGDTLLLEYL